MRNLDELNSRLYQTFVKPIDNNRLRVIVKQNKFAAGTIKTNEQDFMSVPRSPKNLFRLFGGGLGLNAELLHVILSYFSVERIVIPYQDTIFTTTPAKWCKLGIVSPYCDQRVDKQIILPLNQINLEDEEGYQPVKTLANQSQLGLF